MFEDAPSSENIFTDISLSESEKEVWKEINKDYDNNIKEIENYLKLKKEDCDVLAVPAVAFLNKNVFPLLNEAMVEMLRRVIKDDSYYRPKTTFNGIDFISEFLYNRNEKYPERQLNWSYIFDMDWVQTFLVANPRPFYPFHLVWSRDFAAKKIQAFYRAYRERIKKDVQEVRVFWKEYKSKMETEKLLIENENIEEEIINWTKIMREDETKVTDEEDEVGQNVNDTEKDKQGELDLQVIKTDEEIKIKTDKEEKEEDEDETLEEDYADEGKILKQESNIGEDIEVEGKILVQKFIDQ